MEFLPVNLRRAHGNGPEKPATLTPDTEPLWNFMLHLNQRIDHVMWGILAIMLMVAGTLASVLLVRIERAASPLRGWRRMALTLSHTGGGVCLAPRRLF